MRLFKSVLIIAAALLLLPAFSACSQAEPTASTAEPEYAAPIAEEILQALNGNDYDAYTSNFNEAMKTVSPKEVFDRTRAFIYSKIGDYKSRKFSAVSTEDGHTSVIYKAKFSKEPGEVNVTIVFDETEGKMLVSGLWFDSPKLRK